MKFFNFSIFQFFNKSKAFTLVELIITLGIIVVLAGVGFLGILNYKNNQSLNSTSREIVSVLRNAQNRSLSQEAGSRWGVHFENPSSSNDFYDLFYGASYTISGLVSRTTLASGVEFVLPPNGSSSTVIFSPVTGLPNNSLTIKIFLIAAPSVSSTIIVNQNGQIIY